MSRIAGILNEQDAFLSENIKYVTQFKNAIPRSEFIEAGFDRSDPLHWFVRYEGCLYERYEVQLDFEVDISKSGKLEVASSTEPKFTIVEIIRVEKREGRIKSAQIGEIISISLDEWRILIENDFNFKKIDIDVIKDSPVDFFDEYITYERST